MQYLPVEGAPATESTNVYVAYDAQTLYFGIHARYSSRLPNVRPGVTPIFDGYERTNRAIFAKLQYLYRR